MQNIICPLCARRHGQAHGEGCPKVFEIPYQWEEPQAYLEGYLAGRHHAEEVADLFRQRLERLLKNAAEHPDIDSGVIEALRDVARIDGLLP